MTWKSDLKVVQNTKDYLFWVIAPLWYLECAPNCKTRPQLKKITITNIWHSTTISTFDALSKWHEPDINAFKVYLSHDHILILIHNRLHSNHHNPPVLLPIGLPKKWCEIIFDLKKNEKTYILLTRNQIQNQAVEKNGVKINWQINVGLTTKTVIIYLAQIRK